MTGVSDSNSRTFHDHQAFSLSWISNEEIVAQEVMSIQKLVNLHGFANQTWALGSALDIPNWLYGAQ